MTWENHNCWSSPGLKWAQEMLVNPEKMLQETECSQVWALAGRRKQLSQSQQAVNRAQQRKLCQAFRSSALGILFGYWLGHCSWSLSLFLSYTVSVSQARGQLSWRFHGRHGSQPSLVLLLMCSPRLEMPSFTHPGKWWTQLYPVHGKNQEAHVITFNSSTHSMIS